ncbi:MAG: glycosyltransferase family 2 protein [Bacteroidia bacterium]|nr:glycosyltransferase family 2 protein [Bacteroidia bacterium]
MNKNNPKISALLITYNEIEHIKLVLETISFADEIIVVDSFSTDGTLEVLEKNASVKPISRKFINFADQRNFAISQAKYDWILFIDADERIPPLLKDEILELIKNNSNVSGYMIKRQHYYKNKPIYYSGYQTDTTYRLFRNGKVTYDKQRTVHELPLIDGSSAILENKMIHYSFPSYESFKSKVEHYGKLKALELFKEKKKANYFQYILKTTYKFIYNYIIRLGILDGKEGYYICYLNAYGVYYRYKELRRLLLAAPKE